MIVKLLTEHHLKFLSLKGGCTGSSESTLVKNHFVGNHMHWLKYCIRFSEARFVSENIAGRNNCIVSPLPNNKKMLKLSLIVRMPITLVPLAVR